MNRPLIALAATILVGVWVASAQAVTFQLLGSAEVETKDEAASFSLTVGGITATLTTPTGVLNTTSVGFGVDHPAAGDPPDNIDGVHANEIVSVTFDAPVTFDTLVLSLFTPGEGAFLGIAGQAFSLIPQASATDTYNFSTNDTVAVGQGVFLAWAAGNGFSFDSFSVTAAPRAVAEPATLLLLGSGLAGIAAWRRRR